MTSLIENYESSSSSSESESEPEPKPKPEPNLEPKQPKEQTEPKEGPPKKPAAKRKRELPDTDDLFEEEHSVPDFLKKSKEFCPAEKELLLIDDRKRRQVPPKKPRLNFKDAHGPLEPPREVTQDVIDKYASAWNQKRVHGSTDVGPQGNEVQDAAEQGDRYGRKERGGHKSTIMEKEKRKLSKRQNEWRSNSSKGYWKSDEEMKLRQQFD